MKIPCALLILIASATLASADPLAHSIDFKPSGRSAIKMTGPKGARVTGAGIDDTLPTVIKVANEDAFVPVTITFNNESLETKIEVRRNWTSEVSVVYTAPTAAAAEPKKKGRTYVATLRNYMNLCEDSTKWTKLRFELVVHSTGKSIGEFEVASGSWAQLTDVAAGTLDVRIYNARSSKWIATVPREIDRDGVEIWYGCK